VGILHSESGGPVFLPRPLPSFGSRIEQDSKADGDQVQNQWLFNSHREGDGTEKHWRKYRSRIGSTTD
jgi:hypothetical protein